ncbi:transposase [Kitasatospora humi]|uniref:transposase n=1 Tax=Kitasatospora humi TaxID=2893891 RepID=UPI003556BF3A
MTGGLGGLIEPVLAARRARRTGPGTEARVHHVREIMNKALCANVTGIRWEHLPHDFPPCETACGYYAEQ